MFATTRNQNLISPYRKEHKDVYSRLRIITFSKGQFIPQTADKLWLLKKGAVKTLTGSEVGKTTILGYWGEGDVVGSSLSKVNTYKVQCLNTVEAISVPLEQGSFLFKEISHCIQQTDELLRIIRTEKMHSRLSSLLIWFASKFGSQVLQGTLINIRLTHQELAEIMGATRVTVTRLLNQLEQEEMITRPRRFAIIIKNSGLLESKRQ